MSWCHIYYITSVILYIYSGCITASEYYVSADPNGEPCPHTDLPCHNLSYYTADYAFYFTDDTIFYFLEGTHILQGLLEISGVSNITLQGLGHIEQGFHETVMQSTSVIRCSGYNRGGIQFTNSTHVVLKSITIANCGSLYNTSYLTNTINVSIGLYFVDINNVKLEWVSVQNGSGIGLNLYNSFDVLITNSTFANNEDFKNDVGNTLIYYDNQVKKLSRVNIVNSNFTLGLGSGMTLVYDVDNKIEVEVIIENSEFSHNIVQYGGGVYIYINNRSGSTEFSNCTIYNNTAWYGGGVYIYLYNASDSIEFSNCTIYNNMALYRGGGMAIDLYNGSGSIEFSNCTIYNNNAQYRGGGMAIDLYNESGSTEFSNCTIYNNTAWSGGGVLIELYGGIGSTEFSNCTIYNNTAWYGGGVFISLLNGSDSTEFSNCTIYSNIAQYRGGGMAIDLYNGSDSTEFSNCTIYNNIAKHGGGVYIYINNGSGSTEFSNCTIYNNMALYKGGGMAIDLYNGSGSTEFSNCTIYNNIAQNSGGGMAIDLYNESGSTEFSNCTIYNNTAWSGGGVLIELYDGIGSTEFSNCTIYNNTATNGGGVFISLLNGSGSTEFSNCTIYNNTSWNIGGGVLIYLNDGSGSIELSNCTMYDNTAWDGGGVYIYLYNGSGSIEFSNCSIYNNTAYYGSGMFINALQFTSTSSFRFTNVLFQFNKLSKKLNIYQSAVFLLNIENVIFEQIDISNHNTTGLVSINNPIIFDGHSTFVNNSGINGGGIALYGLSQLLLKPNTSISFVNNHASELGGGIFVSHIIDRNFATICSFNNFPYYGNNDTKGMLYFVNNTADISGDVLYGGIISKCNFDFDFDYQFHYPQQTGLSVVSSDPIKVCFCESNIPNCSITNINITAIPGINVNMSLATVGNKDGLTKGVIKLTTSDSSSSTVQTDNTRLNATCTNVTFKLTANPSLNTTQVYVTPEGLISRLTSDGYDKIIEVSIDSCPIGYPLVNDACSCRSELNTSSITCDINTQIITRDGDTWIGYNNDSYCLIVYPHCPFDYCNDGTVHFKITSPDPQCLHNRSGILCGQCSEGLSLMLGSNQCGQCTNYYIALIIPFALAGIALVAFVIVLNLTVSVGTINGLIFYANVVKIYEPIFFPNGPVKLLSQFISWLNLDLGIETCFIDGMDSCSKTWLQFIFPAYVWFLLILIVISSQYSTKVVRLVGSHAVPVLATVILLFYTKLIRTVFKAFYFTNIQCNGNNNVTLLRWYIDANVQYVGGYCHLPLFLFSLAVLVLLIVPYTFYLLAIPLFEGPLSKYMCCCQKYMKPFFDAYGGPYKDKCRFWTGFLLLVRVILALVVSLDIKATISLDVLTSLLFVIISMYFLLKGIYRHLPLACLEMSFFLNLMFMAYVKCTNL